MSVNYEFTHRELRDFAFADPETLLAILSEPGGLEALAKVWNQMEAAAGEPGVLTGRDFASALEIWPDGTRVGVLRLPRAYEMCDAILAAVVVGPGVRFFTLEATRAGPIGQRSGNVLCEWERRDAGFGHANYGTALESPEPLTFAHLVRRVTQGQKID